MLKRMNNHHGHRFSAENLPNSAVHFFKFHGAVIKNELHFVA